jgi:phospholipase C
VPLLVNAFDFGNTDYTVPKLPEATQPYVNAVGNYDGAAYCQSLFKTARPPVPYTGNRVIKNLASLA